MSVLSALFSIETQPYHSQLNIETLLNKENDTTTPSLFLPSEDVIDTHCSTLLMGAIQPCSVTVCLSHDGFQILLLVAHAVCTSVDAIQLSYLPHLQPCHYSPCLLPDKPCFNPFPLHTQFKALSISPASSWARIHFPLLERWDSSAAIRSGIKKTASW